MALQGTLKDFHITEVLHLIGQQLSTGILKTHRGKKAVEIYFVDGMIVHVTSNYRGKKDLIGEIFVKAKLITPEQLERVLRIQKETSQYLGEVLVELQLLTKEDVLRVITKQTYETIYDLYHWEDGSFTFELILVEGYKKFSFAVGTEQVLLNILRMVDDWSEIEKKLYSPHSVFQKTLGGEDKSAEHPSRDLGSREKLATEQELIYNLVDGERTVQEIIDRSLLGRFITSENLVNLLEMGLIENVGIRPPSLVQKAGMFQFRKALPFAYYGTLLLFSFIILVYMKPDVLVQLLNSKIERMELKFPTHFVHQTQMDRIKRALDIYYLEKGIYPSRLEDLISAKLLRKDDLMDPPRLSFPFEVKDGKYILKH